MVKIADYRCNKCGEIAEDLYLDNDIKYECKCGGIMERMYGIRKEMQMLPHLNEHMSHEGVYIEDYQHFKKELKKRGLEGIGLKKPKNVMYFT